MHKRGGAKSLEGAQETHLKQALYTQVLREIRELAIVRVAYESLPTIATAFHRPDYPPNQQP